MLILSQTLRCLVPFSLGVARGKCGLHKRPTVCKKLLVWTCDFCREIKTEKSGWKKLGRFIGKFVLDTPKCLGLSGFHYPIWCKPPVQSRDRRIGKPVRTAVRKISSREAGSL